MRDDTNRGMVGASTAGDETLSEVGLPLEELVRRGARGILQKAMEAEVQELLEQFADVSLIDGRQAVVRSGNLPAREILTTVGPVEVRVPKVRDRTGSGITFNAVRRRRTCIAAPGSPPRCRGCTSRGSPVATSARRWRCSWARVAKGLSPRRPGSPEGAVERGVSRLDASLLGWQGIRRLLGRRHLRAAARKRRPQAFALGDLRRHGRRHQGVGCHCQWPARFHLVLARRAARPQDTRSEDWPQAGRR